VRVATLSKCFRERLAWPRQRPADRLAGKANTPRFILMDDYTPKAAAYWWAVVLSGAFVLLLAAADVASLERVVLSQILLGSAIAALAGFFPVRIPGLKTSIAGGEIFIFLILLIHGAPAAALAAAAEALVAACATSRRWTSRIVSPAMAALAMFSCGNVFSAARLWLNGHGLFSHSAVFLTVAAFTLIYFAANTLLTSSLISLKRNEPLSLRRWLENYGWVGFAYLASGSISSLIFLSFTQFGGSVLFATVPIIAMFLSTLHFYFRQAEANESARQERTVAAERETIVAARHLEQMRDSEHRFQSAFTHAAVGMALVSPDGKLLQVNTALARVLGASQSDLTATSFRDLAHPDDVEVLMSELLRLQRGEIDAVEIELRCQHRQGLDVWASLSVAFFREPNSSAPCLIIQMQDISARRLAEAQLYHIAHHDNLTGLPNRSQFNDQLVRAISRVKRHPQRIFAVMFLDFDRFKIINDSLGHKAGDALLVQVTRRLKMSLRPTDFIARLGGDEFAILVEDLSKEWEAIELAERLQQTLHAPIQLGETEVRTSASIGITFSLVGYETPEEVLRDADIAMYKAKSLGKAQYALFNASLHEQVLSQLHLEGELRGALERAELRLAYQPLFCLKTGALIGFEALARWNHKQRGIVSPAEFIAVAEETGLIVPLGNWVLHEACSQLRQWERLGGDISGLKMHINVSARQWTQPEFVRTITQTLHTAGIRPERLTLEITESVLMQNMQIVLPVLHELRRLGVTLSIDDFGTGYSSLSYLHTLPIDSFKVDRSFVQRLADDAESDEIVRTIVTLGQSLGKVVFAEGIETEGQLRRLKELKCDNAQGYFFSQPLEPHLAANFLVRQVCYATA
jgi:diguanylate cyclase (GGDEF)-like protein/PAS domain S-box-containing protein